MEKEINLKEINLKDIQFIWLIMVEVIDLDVKMLSVFNLMKNLEGDTKLMEFIKNRNTEKVKEFIFINSQYA